MFLYGLFGLLTFFAVTRAEGKWKIWNLLIILGCCGIGFGIAYFAAVWSRNMALGGQLVVPSICACGSLGAVFCPRKKK